MKIKPSKTAGKGSKAGKGASSSSTPFSFASPPSSASSSTDYRAQSAAIPLPASDMKLHGGSPLKNPAPTVKCPDCGKPVLRAAIAEHAVNCQRIRDGLQPESTTTSNDFDNGHGDNHSSYGAGEVSFSNKKRRLSDVSLSTSTPPPSSKKSKTAPHSTSTAPSTAPPSLVPERPSPAPSGSEAGGGGSNWGGGTDGSVKKDKNKKARKEAEKKGLKIEPVDLDRRCGVINDKNTPCLRSLTCKSHGMGPKREVQGRSKPFDVLLLEWNRVNNPRFLEPKPRKNAATEFYTNHFQGGTNGFGGGGGGNGMGGVGGGNGKGGGKNRGGRKKNHGRMNGAGDDDSFDGLGGRGSPESELKSLVAAAKASRARLSAPLASSSSPSNASFSFANNNNNPLSAVPSSFRTGGGPLATYGGMGGGMLMGGLPREGWKGSLYGTRRERVKGLDRSLRDALGVK